LNAGLFAFKYLKKLKEKWEAIWENLFKFLKIQIFKIFSGMEVI